jgi:RHS repeat-associated protein
MKHIYLCLLTVLISLLPYTESWAVDDAIERQALMDLYNSTNGPEWSQHDNWGSSAPFATWYGVTVNANGDVTGISLPLNRLSGQLPESIENLTTLTSLDLSNNQLTGPIPPTIGELINLTSLALTGNQLTESIPPTIGQLINLTILALSFNQLTGPIPPTIGELINLTSLALTGNQLTESIPPAIEGLVKLRTLGLAGNQFSGPIPPELCNLTNLEYVDFFSNQFSGPIPPAIEKLVKLQALDLSYNQFDDNIPPTIGNLVNLNYLVLANNNLTGLIPPTIGNLVNLTTLDLQNNQLTGPIPSTISNIPNLYTLYCSKNFLTSFPSLANSANMNVEIYQNYLDFDDLEPHFSSPGSHSFFYFNYFSQADIGESRLLRIPMGGSLEIPFTTGGQYNQYQWQKKNGFYWLDINGATQSTYQVPSFSQADAGVYRCVVTNTWVTELTLYSKEITVDALVEPASITLHPVTGSPFCVAAGTPLTTSISFTATGGFQPGEVFKVEIAGASGLYTIVKDKVSSPTTITLPTLPGTYSYRIRRGTVLSNTVTVTVLPAVTVTLASSDADNTICQGEAVTFTATSPGNIQSYTFFSNGSTVLQSGPSGSFTTQSLTANQAISVQVTTVDGCVARSTGTITTTVHSLPGVSASLKKHTTCAGLSNGVLAFTHTNGQTYTLLRYGTPVTGQMNQSLAGKGNSVELAGLLSGRYQVAVTNSQGCTNLSAEVEIQDGGPRIIASCFSNLPCSPTGSVNNKVVRIQVSHLQHPEGFKNEYSYILRKGSEVLEQGRFPLATTPNDLYPTATSWDHEFTITNAIVGIGYELQIAAVVAADPNCSNCGQDYCPLTYAFSFQPPSLEPLVSAEKFYVCSSTDQAPVPVRLAATVSECSDPLDGYRLTITGTLANGSPFTPVVITQATEGYRLEYAHTYALAVGTYTVEAIAGTGNYQCREVRTFEVLPRNAQVDVMTKLTTCTTSSASVTVSGMIAGAVSYRWFAQTGSTPQLLAGADAQPYIGSQVEGLENGKSYRVEVTIGGEASCVKTMEFTVAEASQVNKDEIAISLVGCQAKTTAPVPQAGGYRVVWFVKSEKPDVADKNLFTDYSTVGADKALVSLLPDAYLLDKASYYVKIYDQLGCEVVSEPELLEKTIYERTYIVCMQWETTPLEVKPADEPKVQDMPALFASSTSRAIDEVVGSCLEEQGILLKAAADPIACIQAGMHDMLTLTYRQNYHHYTLYYYDRSGNLTKTVPPAGVRPLRLTDQEVVQGKSLTRIAGRRPAHELVTTYAYNSLGQLVKQNTPDGGTTHFVYNKVGQLRLSQNDRQKTEQLGSFSYTKYDALGRIVEVGQAKTTGTGPVFDGTIHAANEALLAKDAEQRITSPDREVTREDRYPKASEATLTEQTITVYSTPATDLTKPDPKPVIGYLNNAQQGQHYLQNRVSYTYTLNKINPQPVYSYYSYDPHGNVEWLAQELPGLGRNFVKYEYDLISGKVLRVNYNEGWLDQFYHRYFYDEDNRITGVETSKDGLLWDRDASYSYYVHGPLRRMELGQDKIQGLDYTYTLHGWLKAINAPVDATGMDPRKDGEGSSQFSADEFGMVLGYYKGDYRYSGATGSVFDDYTPNALLEKYYQSATPRSLYNGNISSWISRMNRLNTATPAPLDQSSVTEAHRFTYDRLNRLRESGRSSWNGNSWTNSSALATTYTYDPNGNLQTLKRQDQNGAGLDNLTYTYAKTASGLSTNRLEKVTDAQTKTPYAEDLEGTSEYTYDAIGNLVQDKGDSVQVNWNVYGKISEVKPSSASSSKPHIKYLYDATGNRIAKEVNTGGAIDNTGSRSRSQPEKIKTTYYVRDAQGNVLGTYQQKLAGTEVLTYLTERPIYGSDRIGTVQESVEITSSVTAETQIASYQWTKVSGPAVTLTNADQPKLLVSSLLKGVYIFRLTVVDNLGNTNYDDVRFTVEDATIESGIKAYWKLDEIIGSTTVDATGNGFTGTVVNGPRLVPGKVGNALEMVDNSSRYVLVPDLKWQPTRFSVAWWMNPASLANYNQQIAATNGWGAFVFHTTSAGEVYVGTDITNRLDATILPAGTVQVNQWQHFVFTFENGVGKFYKNGQLLASKSGLLNPAVWSGFVMGAGNTSSVHGKIDEVRIYERAIEASEVLKLAALPGSPVATNGTGSIQREYWPDIPGSAISSIPVATAPRIVNRITTFEAPTNIQPVYSVAVGDNYGTRIRGYIHPPATGNYIFWIASDETSELWLSTDADPVNKVKIASMSALCTPRQWNLSPSQQSVPIALEAGKKYYIEALHKENTGNDNLAVGWQLPGVNGAAGVLERPIPGIRLSPITINEPIAVPVVAPVVSIASPVHNTIVEEGVPTTLKANASDPAGIQKVEFFANNTLVGETAASPYEVTWTGATAGVYRITVKLTNTAGQSTASEATTVVVGSAVAAQTPLVNAGADQVLATLIRTATLTGTGKASTNASQFTYLTRKVGAKTYELKDHLGNVRVLVGDLKTATFTQTSSSTANVFLSAAIRGRYNYYPFGMMEPDLQEVNRGLTHTGTTSNQENLIASVSNTFTMEVWVNPTATHEIDAQSTTGTLGTNGQRFAIFPSHGAGSTESGVGISVGTNGVSVYELAGSYMPAILVWQGAVKGWTHIAVVYTNRQPKLYVNGELVATGLTSPRTLVHPSASITGGYYGGFLGTTDEVRIWNRALTGEEIKANKNVYLTGTEPGLVAYYPMNEGSGTVLTDVSTRKLGGNKALNNNTAWLPLSTVPISTPDLLASYRYGFNGKEMDNEVSGTGNSYDYGFRIYNPRIAKFLSVDPLTRKYPFYSPYHFAGNTPILSTDIDGLEPDWLINISEKIGNFVVEVKDDMVETGKSTANLTSTFGTGVYNAATVYIPQAFGFKGRKEAKLNTTEGTVEWGSTEATKIVQNSAGKVGKDIVLSGATGIVGKIAKPVVKPLLNKISQYTIVSNTLFSGIPFVFKKKLAGAGLKYACDKYAKSFMKAAAEKSITGLEGATIRHLRMEGATNFMTYEGKNIAENGFHEFIEVTTKNGEQFIYDNMNPKGVLKSEWWSKFDAIPKQQPFTTATGAQLEQFAKELASKVF